MQLGHAGEATRDTATRDANAPNGMSKPGDGLLYYETRAENPGRPLHSCATTDAVLTSICSTGTLPIPDDTGTPGTPGTPVPSVQRM